MAVTPEPARPDERPDGAARPDNPTRSGEPAQPDPSADAVLACGRDAATVWEHARSGAPPDGHERGCPSCQGVRADAGRLDAMVARLAQLDVAPPPAVVDRVLTAVRTQLRPHELLALGSPLGPAAISATAAAAVLRGVVDRVSAVRARSCRITQAATPDTTGIDTAIDVALTVTARFGEDLTAVSARVRQLVTAAGREALGLPVRTVDIEVVDLWDTPPSEGDRT